jgi:hypothetical protein
MKPSMRLAAWLAVWLGAALCLGGAVAPARAADFDPGPYQQFLDTYMIRGQTVGDFTLNILDYRAIHASREQADSLYGKVLAGFAAFDPEGLPDREARIAFWINAYNVGAIKMIVDHYPVDSIRSSKINWFKKPWTKKVLDVGGRKYSLNAIEHDILLARLGEPLAHFAIVCASLSCPELRYEVYRGETLNAQLADQARLFLADSVKGLAIDREHRRVFFSKIFQFDKKTFPKGAESAVEFIAPFLEEGDGEYLLGRKYGIEYLEYDWSLNGR